MFRTIAGISFCILMASMSAAQDKKENKSMGLGLKAGYNFAKVTGASSVNAANNNGFLIGAFYSPGRNETSWRGFRTELIFSRQGYNFARATTTGNVQLDYLLLPQLATFNITKYFQIQLGGQIAFLLNALADSTVNNTSTSNQYNKVAGYYNKFDYGFAGGIEAHPLAGLMVGARFNISLANVNKEISPGAPSPSFIPSVSGANLRNNVLQIFAGWKF